MPSPFLRFFRRWIPIPVASGFQCDACIGSALVSFYLNFSEVGDAMVFDGMSERDTVTWNAFVSSRVKVCNFVPALQDRRANSTLTRRASLIYTRTSARESHTKKVGEAD